jgi:hypothetical protein
MKWGKPLLSETQKIQTAGVLAFGYRELLRAISALPNFLTRPFSVPSFIPEIPLIPSKNAFPPCHAKKTELSLLVAGRRMASSFLYPPLCAYRTRKLNNLRKRPRQQHLQQVSTKTPSFVTPIF